MNFSNKENSCVGRGNGVVLGLFFFWFRFFLEFEPVLNEGGGGGVGGRQINQSKVKKSIFFCFVHSIERRKWLRIC